MGGGKREVWLMMQRWLMWWSTKRPCVVRVAGESLQARCEPADELPRTQHRRLAWQLRCSLGCCGLAARCCHCCSLRRRRCVARRSPNVSESGHSLLVLWACLLVDLRRRFLHVVLWVLKVVAAPGSRPCYAAAAPSPSRLHHCPLLLHPASHHHHPTPPSPAPSH